MMQNNLFQVEWLDIRGRMLRPFFASLRMTSRQIVLTVEALLRVECNIKRGSVTAL